MKKLSPILAKHQPYLWKQAIRNTDFRGYSLRNTLLHPIIEHNFSFKNHSSYYFDHLIIGSNPILTYFLLDQLHALTQLNKDKKSSIGIFFTDEYDYWAYHILQKPEIWQLLQPHFKNKQFNNFSSFLASCGQLVFDEPHHELILINSSNMSLLNCRYDQYMDGYVLNASDKNYYKQNGYQNTMPTILQEEHRLLLEYKTILDQHLNQLSSNSFNQIKEINFPDKKHTSEDSSIPTHLLLAHRIWLTNQPQNWLASDLVSNNQPVTYNDQLFSETIFNNIVKDYSFGSAKHIANTFDGLEEQSIYDILDIYNKPIKNR